MQDRREDALSKVPEVTLAFWVVKIVATTLGETGGDWVSMSLHLGYAVGSAILITIFIAAVFAQITVRSFQPFLYWSVVVATTTAGTTMADFADRSLGVGYAGGSAILLVLLLASLGAWYWSGGSVAVDTVKSHKVETLYWVTILFSQTLGTALGDWMAGSDRNGLGLGYEYGGLVFSAALALVMIGHYYTTVSRTLPFWAAFILTRPPGATVSDPLDKPLANGGFALSRSPASEVLVAFMAVCLLMFRQRAAARPVPIRVGN